MTSHELARKLLEGPDVPVVHEVAAGYGETETVCLDSIEHKTMWQIQVMGKWREEFDRVDPSNSNWPVRPVAVVEVR